MAFFITEATNNKNIDLQKVPFLKNTPDPNSKRL